jgi:alkaline phosphatase
MMEVRRSGSIVLTARALRESVIPRTTHGSYRGVSRDRFNSHQLNTLMNRPALLSFVAVCAFGYAHAFAEDHIRELQTEAVITREAEWGHWGPDASKYSSWLSHSNRLIPVYTFGVDLSSVSGGNSIYRHADRLESRYGFLPSDTLNPEAIYFDQTDIYRLQKLAVQQGKKRIILFVFDGMDWWTTYAAAIHKSGRVGYREGRGSGLHFQDYRGAPTDFGYMVTSPHSDGAKVSVNRQAVTELANVKGGFDWRLAGDTPWSLAADPLYLIAKSKTRKHAYTDSSSSASSMTAGIKSYNDSVNVDPLARRYQTIAHEVQDQGWAVGVVTSVPISHATPACAYSHNVHRDDYQDLTRDLLGIASIAHPEKPLPGVDVLIGAGFGERVTKDDGQGRNFVRGNKFLAANDLQAIDVRHGGRYVVVQRTKGESGSKNLMSAARQAIDEKQRLFGYFGVGGGHLPFRTADGDFEPTVSMKSDDKLGPIPAKAEIYRPGDIFENPTLDDMATAALDVLANKSDKFWLMVEAGDVDWANHANNIDNSIGAVISGDDAFRAVTDWIESHGGWQDTAVILTADHGHYLVLPRPEMLLPKQAEGIAGAKAKADR